MLVTCQRFGDWFLFGLVWQYSSIQKNIIKVGAKSWMLTCSCHITLSLPFYTDPDSKRELDFFNGYLSLLYFCVYLSLYPCLTLIQRYMYNFAFIINVKGKSKKQSTLRVEKKRLAMKWKAHTPETRKHHRLKSYITASIVPIVEILSPCSWFLFPFFLSIVCLSWNFVRFHEILLQICAKIFSFLSCKKKFS